MTKNHAAEYVSHIEFKSYPTNGRFGGKYTGHWNGNKIEAKSTINAGRSGKGFTTTFYFNGRRIARAKLVELMNATTA